MTSHQLSVESVSGNYHECCPLFIERTDYVICASGSIVHAISSKTGELIGSFHGHSASVTSIKVLNVVNTGKSKSIEKNMNYLISSSVDGSVCVWNLVRPGVLCFVNWS